MPPVGIGTHDPSKRSTADLRLRPRGHWDRRRHTSGVGIQLQSFLTSELYGVEWSNSQLGHFTPGKEPRYLSNTPAPVWKCDRRGNLGLQCEKIGTVDLLQKSHVETEEHF
jgi:hypothetical protein